MKGTAFTTEKISPRAGLEPGTSKISRLALTPLSYGGSSKLTEQTVHIYLTAIRSDKILVAV